MLLLAFYLQQATASEGLPPPMILSVDYPSSPVERYSKFEVQVDLSAEFANPYDYDEIALTAQFTSPGGAQYQVDGFYMQDYALNTQNGSLAAQGNGAFRVRFAPDELGEWTFSLNLTDESGNSTAGPFSFSCAAIVSPNNHGFVRTNNSRYLSFDDGTPYIPIGENIAWQNSNPYLNYSQWLDGLITNGANFFRLWHAHWGLGIEWSNGNGFNGLRRYKQTNCYYQDWLFDYCAENGLYIMLALQHHGPVSTQVNPNWNDSPYNIVNGGMCLGTQDFFIDEQAKADTRNRYRYIIARWGYSRSILCWELFNEVHWTDNYELYKEQVAEWHLEMASYLKDTDPQERIVTTSYGETTDDENVWSDANFDLTQSHIYLNAPNIERALAAGNARFLEAFEKPTLNGEFGLGGTSSLANTDPDGIHFHNAMWGSLFSGALGTAMSWWWDSYIHPRDLYYHYNGISAFSSVVPFVEEQMSPVPNTVSGAPGDLQLTPSLGWAVQGDSEVMISAAGITDPAVPTLSSFLYGSQWNTEFRQPPTFSLTTTTPITFSVHTGDQSGTTPILEINLNGTTILRDTAQVNTVYQVAIPAGTHTLSVDNTGTDWIMIAAYVFSDLGSNIHAYTLRATDRSVLAGWALNANYNHLYLAANGEPEPTPPVQILIDGFLPGASYQLSLYEPLSGTSLGNDIALADDSGTLSVPVPSFLWDIAFIIEGSPVATRQVQQHLAFDVFPNPIAVGADMQIRLPTYAYEQTQIAMLDAAGLPVYQQTRRGTEQGFTLPAEIPAGTYWIHIQNGEKRGIQPLIVVE